MSSRSPHDSDEKQAPPGKVIAGGAGLGTLILLLINNLPDDSPWKPILTLLAPTISAAGSASVIWLRRKYLRRKRRNEAREAVIDAELSLRDRIRDYNLPQAERNEARRQLAELQRRDSEAKIARAEAAIARRDQDPE